MSRVLSSCIAFVVISLVATAQPLVAPFEFTIPSWDSSQSAWFPWLLSEPAGVHGFARVSSEGRLEFSDGTPARFVGVGIIQGACFPDSVGAIVTARRLRTLGVNMVRFNYFDYHNSNSISTLAPSGGSAPRFDSLSPTQMARLDWFLYQLKLNGIYTHFVLKSRQGPRAGDGVPYPDSTYFNGQYIALFSQPMQALHRTYLTRFLTHVNPYTGSTYANEPAIALMTIIDQNSLYEAWVGDRLRQRSGILSFHQSRLLDTLYADYLRRRYPTTAAIKDAYFEGVKNDGPNSVKNGSFESFTDNWTLTVGEGAQASVVAIEGPNVAPGEGQYSLRVAVRQVNGNENRLYLDQVGTPVRKGGIYRISFKAKTDSASGRQLRVAMLRGGTNLGLNQTVNLTTAWQPFTFVFRALDSDTLTSTMRFYIGRSMGDIFLDAVSFQETGRDGVQAGEALETSTIARARFADVQTYAVRRVTDLAAFYDSLARSYYRTMRAHLQSLGVRVPIAGTNNTTGSADTWIQSEYDFTSETAQWDFNGTRPGASGYSDSTWVIRNYSVLNYRDQKIPEFSRNAIVGKPFIAEAYNHVYPNSHRSEMMIFYPAYAALHDWDGTYFNLYNDRTTELVDRRRIFKDDFSSIISDASIIALMPQVTTMLRERWIAPSERPLLIRHDVEDLRNFPLTYGARGFHQVDGTFGSVVNLLSAVRIDSFDARRHYTAGDYYFTTPTDDNIESDTRQIRLDMTKGVMSLNAPKVQGGSGVLGNVSALRTDHLGVNWIEGGRHVTYLWTTLDTGALASARRSLLTVTTRVENTGAVWQFGDSSLGKLWGIAPLMMESATLGVNFYTDADSIVIHPLDSMGRERGESLGAMRTPTGAWRAIINLAELQTPWFGVEQRFAGDPSDVETAESTGRIEVGEVTPNPSHGEATIRLTIPRERLAFDAKLYDGLGREVRAYESGGSVAGESVLSIETRGLSAGIYMVRIRIGEALFVRRLVIL